jgi:hypothetical protein
MNEELSMQELTDMDSVALASYIRDRLSMNNYAEAKRATAALMIRMTPEPVPRGTVSERIADALVAAHMAGQTVGEKRYEKVLSELLRVVVDSDAENIEPRTCSEDEYQSAVKEAARALGVLLPAGMLEGWAL